MRGVKYQVAFSLSGTDVEMVRPIACALQEKLGGNSVFFHPWKESETVGCYADDHLLEIYETATLVVPCLSPRYLSSVWTNKEHDKILARAAKENKFARSVMPLKIESAEIPGYFRDSVIHLNVQTKSTVELVDIFLDRLKKLDPTIGSFFPPEVLFRSVFNIMAGGKLLGRGFKVSNTEIATTESVIDLMEREVRGASGGDLELVSMYECQKGRVLRKMKKSFVGYVEFTHSLKGSFFHLATNPRLRDLPEICNLYLPLGNEWCEVSANYAEVGPKIRAFILKEVPAEIDITGFPLVLETGETVAIVVIKQGSDWCAVQIDEWVKNFSHFKN